MESGLNAFNEQEIQSFSRQFESLFNERQPAIMASYYSDDARILAPDTDVSGVAVGSKSSGGKPVPATPYGSARFAL
jgi:hypothetical protein